MYSNILLTLDRSPLAEQAIPHAVAIAKAFNAKLHVVTVVPVLDKDAMLAAGVSINWEADTAESEEYLTGVKARLDESGISADTEVRRGEITQEILDYAGALGADLIVMSTHGRSGLGRWVYGSVADRVLRHAESPVLLVRTTDS